MDLRATAVFAEHVAAGLTQFREPLPEYTAEITNLIADLYAISATLTSLNELAQARPYRHNIHLVKPDIELVRSSLTYTLDEIFDAFGRLDGKGSTIRSSYKRTWIELCTFFRSESNYPLSRRLRKYRLFLTELEDLMQKYSTSNLQHAEILTSLRHNSKYSDVSFMTELRRGITTLLSEQDGRLAAQLGTLALEPPGSPGSNSAEPGSPVEGRGPGKRRSYERPRPNIRAPQSPLSDPLASLSPTSSDIPPYVPDVPGSPTSNSTATQSNPSSAILNDHWARKVFADDISITRLPLAGERSKCLGRPTPDIKQWLFDQGFDEVLYLPFENESSLSVHFYVREHDHRVRIVCKVRHSSRSSEYFCLPLNLLELDRDGPCLQLCRRRQSGMQLVPWANLKFPTIEKLVTFFCTFLALRSQDFGKPVSEIRDYELEDEEEMFGGLIVEDRYLHALRIYKDHPSGAVRLQASVHEGEMKRSPVWTAFITHHISSPAWLRPAGSKVVHIRELRRIVFSAEYTPPRTPRGEYILKFTSQSDARGFVETIDELAAT